MAGCQIPPFLLPVAEKSFALPTRKPESSSSVGRPNKRKDARKSAGGSRVLLLGRVHELALYRAEVLRDRGFDVRTSTNKEEALKLIQRSDFDVLVLSYTLSSEMVERLAEEAREHCPHCPLVVIAKTRHFDRKIAPDGIALADDGPKALVAALRRVLRQQ